MPKQRIPLTPGYHAEPGLTAGHLHDIYTTVPPLGGNQRLHCGELTKAAVDAWAAAGIAINAMEKENAELKQALADTILPG